MEKPDPERFTQQLPVAPAPGPHPQLDAWDPPLSGEIAIRIDRNGTWYHDGSPIRRPALVKLFASILRRETDGGYYLVTPVEKLRIQVDDAPFLAVRLECDLTQQDPHTQQLLFTTNLGETVSAGPDHPIEVRYSATPAHPARADEPRPYITVRPGLQALITRSVFIQLAGLAVEVTDPTSNKAGYAVWGGGQRFWLGADDG